MDYRTTLKQVSNAATAMTTLTAHTIPDTEEQRKLLEKLSKIQAEWDKVCTELTK